MNKLPKAKSENIVVQNLRDEVLIYDLTTDQAFCLNETSASIFNRCDGKTTFDELKAEHNLTDGIIFLALDGLQKENLLVDEYVSPFAKMSRREVIRKVGLATLIALPVISSLVAPVAARAGSTCNSVGQFCACRGPNDNAPCGQGESGFTCPEGCACRGLFGGCTLQFCQGRCV